jgi:hypothetical protein
MRTGVFIGVALFVAVIGYLGFRILDLEQRVAALALQLDSAPAEPDPLSAPAGGLTGTSKPGYEQRLLALEQRLSELKSQRRAEPPESFRRDEQTEKGILSVVERENQRIRDVQLEFHRAHWVDQRNAALILFAQGQGLSADQTTELQKLLVDEIDSAVTLLRKGTMLEDPDQAAIDWQAMLDETDAKARNHLKPEQRAAWNEQRANERRFLWPWLPNNMNK